MPLGMQLSDANMLHHNLLGMLMPLSMWDYGLHVGGIVLARVDLKVLRCTILFG